LFRLGEWTVWAAGYNGKRWATAELVNDHYTHHEYHDTLAEAFEHVSAQLLASLAGANTIIDPRMGVWQPPT
jgi:hypothetical protein